MSLSRPRSPLVVFLTLIGLLSLNHTAAAQSTWNKATGGPYNWGDATNWTGGVPNAAGAVANLTNNITANITINLNNAGGAGTTFALTTLSIADATPSNSFTIAPGSGGSLQFTGAGAGINFSSGTNLISAPIALLADTTVRLNTGGSGSLTLAGTVTTGPGNLIVEATGNSNGALTSGVIVSGQITGTGGLTKTSGNFLHLTSSLNDYSGATTITSGAVRLSGGGVLSANSNLVFNASGSGSAQLFAGASFTRALGTGAGEVQWTGHGGFGTIGQALTVNLGGAGAGVTWGVGGFVPSGSNLQLGSTSSDNTITFVNPVDLGAAAPGLVRIIDVQNGSAQIDAVFSGAFSNAADPTLGNLAKTGGGTVRFDASPTFIGVLAVTQGTLAFGPGVSHPGTIAVTGGAVFSPPASATYTAGLGTGPGQIDLAPAGGTVGGGFGAVGGPVTVNLGGTGGTVVWNQGNFVPDGQALLLGSSSSDGTVTFVNPIDLNGGARTIQANDGAAGTDGVITGVLSNSSAGLTKSGSGVLELAAANTFGGGVTITGGGLRINSDAANPGDPAPLGLVPAAPGANVTVNGGNLIFGSAFTLHPNRQISIPTGANNGIDTNGLSVAVAGKITGAGGFVKTGAGTLTLTAPAGTSDYAGATFVNNGTLAIGAANTLPVGTTLTLGNGASVGHFDATAFDQTVGGILVRSDNAAATNTVTIGAGRTLAVSNANAPANAGTATEVPFVLLNNGGNSTANAATGVTFTGGGNLVVNTPQGILHAGQAGGIPAFGNNGTVDLSGLASLTATVTELRVGDFGNGGANPGGATVLTLAQSNTITASRSISVGASGRTSGLGPTGFQVNALRLGGGTNVLNANNVYLGSNVRNATDTTSSINLITSPRSAGAIVFAGSTGTLTLRGSDGTSRSNLFLGVISAGTPVPRINTFDVSGHAADLALDQLVVGGPANYSATGGPLDNVFAFDTGTLNVNTIAVARQAGSTTTPGLANMTGTVTLGGGTVTVNTGPITLATVTAGGATGAGTSVTNTGTLTVSGGNVTVLGGGVTLGNNTATNLANLAAVLNVSGGTLSVGGAITPGAVTSRVTSTLNLTGGTLNMQGNAIGNLTNLTFSGGTLQNPGAIGRAVTQSGGTLLVNAPVSASVAGAYTLTGGTARVDAGTLTASGGIAVGAAATLAGSGGTVTGGVTVAGTLAPGTAAGTPGRLAHDAGTMTWQPGGTFRLVYNSLTPNTTGATHSIVAGSGTLDISTLAPGNTFALDILSQLASGTPTGSVSYTIASLTGGTAGGTTDVTDRFTFSGAGYASAPSVTFDGVNLVVSFTPVPVPEPAGVLLVCAAGAGLAGWLRRGRRKGASV